MASGELSTFYSEAHGSDLISYVPRIQKMMEERMPVLFRVKPSSWLRSSSADMCSSSLRPRDQGFKFFRNSGGHERLGCSCVLPVPADMMHG